MHNHSAKLRSPGQRQSDNRIHDRWGWAADSLTGDGRPSVHRKATLTFSPRSALRTIAPDILENFGSLNHIGDILRRAQI